MMKIGTFSDPNLTIYGMTPIRCNPIMNISITAKKPCYLPLPSEDDTSLGAELKRERLKMELTQSDCAKLFGVNKSTYQDYEWNKIVPEIKKRKMINKFVGYNYWDDNSGSFANRVLLYRIENKLTRMELAKAIGVCCDSTIERIEKNIDVVSEELKGKIDRFISKSDFETENVAMVI